MTSLVGGGPLQIEDLDLSGWGLYTEDQIDQNNLADYEPAEWLSWGRTLYRRKSELGVKYHIYEDKELKLWKDIK